MKDTKMDNSIRTNGQCVTPSTSAMAETRPVRRAARRRRRATSSVLSVALASTVAVATFGSTALAATTTTFAPLRACTNLGNGGCQQVFATTARGDYTTLTCWQDDSSYAGTNRWFFASTSAGPGFISAAQVASQYAVPPCQNVAAVKAVNWAGQRLGQNVYVNWCLQFVHDAWLNAGKDIGSANNAISYWTARPSLQHRGDINPPVGALVFWGPDAYNADGHVALSLGGGRTVSTYERSTVAVHVMSIQDRNLTKKTYLGWIMP